MEKKNKTPTKKQKEDLIISRSLEKYLSEKIEYEKYRFLSN